MNDFRWSILADSVHELHATAHQRQQARANRPPGLYDLRAERGVILAYKIRVDKEDLNVGHVVEPAPLDVLRPFQHEGVAETIVENAAPATANLGGRPLQAMRYGHEAMAPFGAPVGTPAPESTPLGEATPAAAPSPSAMMMK